MEAGEEPVQQKTFRVILHRTMQTLHKAEDFRSEQFAYQISPALKSHITSLRRQHVILNNIAEQVL